jgi:hypothetical protein
MGAMVTNIDGLFQVKVERKGACIEVGENGPDQNNRVARFDELTNGFVHELSVVHANICWLLLFKCGFVRKHGGEREPGSIHERLDGVLQPRTIRQEPWQNARGPGYSESFDDFSHCPFKRCGVAFRWIERR